MSTHRRPSKQLIEKVDMLLSKGVDLAKEGGHEAAISTFNEIIDMSAVYRSEALRERVVMALGNKGIGLGKLDRYEEAIASFDGVVELCSGSDSKVLREQMAKALVHKGVALGKLGRYEDEIASHGKLVELHSDSDSEALVEQVAKALFKMGITLGKLERYDDEIAAYDKLVELYSDSDSKVLRGGVAMALVNKGVALGKLERYEDAVVAFDKLAEFYSDSDSEALQEATAKALVNKGIVFAKLEQYDDAIASYDRLVDLYSGSDSEALREQVARALGNRGAALVKLERYKDAIASYEGVVGLYSGSDSEVLREQVAKALVNKGVALVKLEQYEDAIASYEGVVELYSGTNLQSLRTQVASALINKVITLKRLRRYDEATSICDEILAQVTPEDGANLTRAGILGRILKAEILWARKYHDRARKALQTVLDQGLPQDLEMYVKTQLATLGPYGVTGEEYVANLMDDVRAQFSEEQAKKFESNMQELRDQQTAFLSPTTRFADDFPLMLTLRRWNSYTPSLPSFEKDIDDVGGGYYLRLYDPKDEMWKGIVVDPGFNFIDNFNRYGGRLRDIDCVILTHAHNDHTADFESICGLLYQFNKQAKTPHKIDLYMNLGCSKKFSGWLDLRGADYLRKVVVLNVGDRQLLIPGVGLYVLPTYHDEVVSKCYGVGLAFDIEDKSLRSDVGRGTRILFTGDTALYPSKKIGKGRRERIVADIDREGTLNIVERYRETLKSVGADDFLNELDIVIAHIGSIYPTELAGKVSMAERIYPNHLGIYGTLAVFFELQPELGLVSEFGIELRKDRLTLVEGIAERCVSRTKAFGISQDDVRILPADPGFICNIRDKTAYCIDEKKMLPWAQLHCCSDGNIYYCARETKNNFPKEDVATFGNSLQLARTGILRPPHLNPNL